MRRGDVFITYHTTSIATALECVQNEFNTTASYFSRMDNNNKETSLFVFFMAYTIDKQVFLETFPFIIHTIRSFNGVGLPVTTTCLLCSNSGLTRMQILLNLICL